MDYVIKKGGHSSDRMFPFLTFKNKVVFDVKFIGSFRYRIKKQKDTNKLIGLSDSWHHHRNSVRVGWRWNSVANNVELMAIIYSNGYRTIKHLKFLPTSKRVLITIEIKDKQYSIKINHEEFLFERTSNWGFIRYGLSPYFGGDTVAPKDFRFTIKRIKNTCRSVKTKKHK
jgi:hypothetical protein